MKINKNVQNTEKQIINTLEMMQREKIISYFNLPEIEEDKENNLVSITWKNHVGGRNVSSKAFLTVNQYLTIFQANAYHALMCDNSIIRCNFTFSNEKLISQNLLWWPCPIEIDNSLFEGYELIETIKSMLEKTITSSDVRMRTPIRIDFDVNNNKPDHPRAHVHMQHHECRINVEEPICFNKFIKFILHNCYPGFIVPKLDMLSYQYDDKYTTLDYENKTNLLLNYFY